MSNNIRTQRVNSVMQQHIATLLNGGLKDLELSAMTGVTFVNVTPDLKHAKVGISIYGDEQSKKENYDRICNAKGSIKKALSRLMSTMHCMPDLHFELDTSLDYSEHINKILEELRHDD